jgi:molybdopterin/thiamine biosynthesis adenylyltransferase
MTTSLHAPTALWRCVRDDLLSTPHLERAAIGFAGLSINGEDHHLLLRDWVPVPPSEYVVQLGHHLEVSPAFWARHAKRARATGEGLVVMHSHPMDDDIPRFSPSDDAGEAALVPRIHARAAVPVAAVVISPGGEAARVTDPGRLTVELGLQAGSGRRAASARCAPDRFDRQLRVLGREGQAVLSNLSVGVVGAGGLGSHVIQQLSHLGVGRLVVVDPDVVSRSNLSRLVGASRLDPTLRTTKVSVARRVARRVGGPTRVVPIRGSVIDAGPARRLVECDVVVGCTDTQWSRTVLNAIAYQYYVPVLDLGVELQAGGSMGGRITWLAPGSACLWCRGVLDGQRVRAEQLPREALVDEVARGYLPDLDEPAPAVVSINGVVASLAVTELLARVTGFTGREARASQLMYRLADGAVRRTSDVADPRCPTCSASGQLGLGDLGTSPWRG